MTVETLPGALTFPDGLVWSCSDHPLACRMGLAPTDPKGRSQGPARLLRALRPAQRERAGGTAVPVCTRGAGRLPRRGRLQAERGASAMRLSARSPNAHECTSLCLDASGC